MSTAHHRADCSARGNVDDTSTIAHESRRSIGAHPNCSEIQTHRGIPFFGIKLCQRSLDRGPTGVVDPDIKMSEFGDGFLCKCFNSVIVGDISGESNCAPTTCTYAGGDSFNFVSATSRTYDCGPRLGQGVGDAFADSPSCTRDDSNVIRQIK